MTKLKYLSKVELSIRRKDRVGLPGDDPTLHNLKIGSSLKNQSPLRGLTYNEEVKYLPAILNVSSTDNEWRSVSSEYWNNISVAIPSDATTVGKFPGKLLTFTVAFENEGDKTIFEKEPDFEAKTEFLKKLEINGKVEVVENIGDYILFRYCLVYSKVANRMADVNKSPKIKFYLYSKDNEIKASHAKFKARVEANAKFAEILMKEDMVDAVLLLFAQKLEAFDGLASKHLALEGLIKTSPQKFLDYIKDDNLITKAKIKKAVEQSIIYNPLNTESYYYGDSNEVLLGTTLKDAVLFWKSEDNANVITVIESRLKNL